MLLLSSGMAGAQEAVQITVPIAPAPAAPATPTLAAPTIVVPEAAPVAAPATPVVAETVAPEPARASRAATTVRPAARVVSAAALPSAAAVINRAPAPAAAQPAPAVTVDPVPAPQAETPPAEVAPTSDVADWALPVGAAATLLVLGGVGLAMTRRRRAWEEDADFVPPVVNRPATRPMVERRVGSERPAAPVLTNSAPPASADDRAELMERMVVAAPDEANPFTSRKARRRRARLIIQSMPQTTREPAQLRAPQYGERPLQDHRVLATL